MATSEPVVGAATLEEKVRKVLMETLQISDPRRLRSNTELLGSLPEFDSMAVVGVLTAFEEHFNIEVEDDEISAEIFQTVGTITDFLAEKVEN